MGVIAAENSMKEGQQRHAKNLKELLGSIDHSKMLIEILQKRLRAFGGQLDMPTCLRVVVHVWTLFRMRVGLWVRQGNTSCCAYCAYPMLYFMFTRTDSHRRKRQSRTKRAPRTE